MVTSVTKGVVRGGWLRKLFLLILSIPVFVLLTELLFLVIPVDTYFQNRFFLVNRALDYPEVFKKDSQVFWRLRPSQKITSRFFEGKEYRINSYGLRGDEIPGKSDRIRITALGNSCTFGWGVREDQTYIRQLGDMLERDPAYPPTETINGGVPGYSTFQERRFFVTDILPLEPDIVLLMFAWNDQWAAAGNISDEDQKPPPEIIIDIQNIFSRLKVYRLTKKLLLSILEEPLEDKLVRESPVYRVDIPDFYNNLEFIVRQCRQNNITPILLTSPIPSLEKYYPPGKKSMMHNYHQYYNRQIRSLARNSKTALVDLAAEFDKYDNLFDDASHDPIHFNEKGHKVAAELLYDHLKNLQTSGNN